MYNCRKLFVAMFKQIVNATAIVGVHVNKPFITAQIQIEFTLLRMYNTYQAEFRVKLK